VTILIIWSPFFHFKYLWNLQTAHHWSQTRHQKVTKDRGTDVIGEVSLYQ